MLPDDRIEYYRKYANDVVALLAGVDRVRTDPGYNSIKTMDDLTSMVLELTSHITYRPRMKKDEFFNKIKDTLKSLHYEIDKNNGEYLTAMSIHKWDESNNKPISVNGKRIIELRYDKEFTYFCIKEDGGTRRVFNGIVRDLEDIILIEKLTKYY